MHHQECSLTQPNNGNKIHSIDVDSLVVVVFFFGGANQCNCHLITESIDYLKKKKERKIGEIDENIAKKIEIMAIRYYRFAAKWSHLISGCSFVPPQYHSECLNLMELASARDFVCVCASN